ncbi:MAG: glycoside hydrolase family 2 TIM barrel-domain containing protein [Gemmataceae bacterium]
MVRYPLLALLLAPAVVSGADWKPAPAPLMTRWGKQITADQQPWAEYPRPQMVRRDWQNLNGLWDYAITPKGDAKPDKWDGKILVPFCVESALSGVGKMVGADKNLWYRTTINVPDAWTTQRLLLHFGAVDWESTVWVNGKELGTHKGGSDPFTYDIADALKNGQGELIVRVWDPTDEGSQPRGKQVSKPGGIWYTPVTGIWQTVWLEPVYPGYIKSVRFTPDIDRGEVECLVETDGPVDGVFVAAGPVVPNSGHRMGAELARGQAGKPFRFKPADVRLWSPDSPVLHYVTVDARRHPANVGYTDAVGTYFAMRKISAAKDEQGVMRLMLNNQPLFQLGPLDQGWWPDGLLTPPSDAALKYDVEVLKKLGMNMLRKHIKVEPARFYYHCDTLGMLVWQDMPSGMIGNNKGGENGSQHVMPNAKEDAKFKPEDAKQFRAELKAMIDHLRGFPCIVVWVPFNEGWGQHDTNEVLKWVKGYDPSRLVNGPSGWTDRGYGDMKDMHAYPGPNMFPVLPDRVSVLGEFGGLGLPVKGHLWKDQGNWGYRTYKTTDQLRDNYHRLMARLHPLIGNGLSAAVYTQTTDVEVEVNGLLTYDREVLKLDPVETAGWHKALFGPAPTVKELVPTSEKTPQTWKYTLEAPADGWEKPKFDDAMWKAGPGGFGSKGTPAAVIGTEWTGKQVWLRREVKLTAVPAGEVMLRFHCDEDGEVFINGVPAATLSGYTTDYVEVPISAAARAALTAGTNLVAVRAKNAGGGQYIDVGLVEVVPPAGR